MEPQTPQISNQPQSPRPPVAQPSSPVSPRPIPAQPQAKSSSRGFKLRSVDLKSPRASILSVILFIIAIFVFLLAYFIFSKPDTGPASLIFNKIFPKESGLIRLQEVDLDIDSIVNNPVFSRLKEQSPLPLEIPPLGKPNPFL
ncbi:MAG: hypothetical protein AB1721_02705 [Patescibacteria group bacterium]